MVEAFIHMQNMSSDIEFEESKKQNLSALPLTNLSLSNQNNPGKNDHNIKCGSYFTK